MEWNDAWLQISNVTGTVKSRLNYLVSRPLISLQRLYEEVQHCPHASVSKHDNVAGSSSGV